MDEVENTVVTEKFLLGVGPILGDQRDREKCKIGELLSMLLERALVERPVAMRGNRLLRCIGEQVAQVSLRGDGRMMRFASTTATLGSARILTEG